MRRAGALLVAALLLVAGTASPAAAHAVGGVESTNYRSEIRAITPTTPGVQVRLLDLGGRIEVVNETAEDVTVLGYQSEPYLRVGPSGVYENRNSPSLYQNEETDPSEIVQLPPNADPGAAPHWKKRGDGRRVTWRDHRTRWEGADPPGVEARPRQEQTVVSRWTVGLLHGTDPVTVTGRIAWVPRPAAAPGFLGAAGLFALTFAAGATKWWPKLLSSALALLVAVDIVRFVGEAMAVGDSLVSGLLSALLSGILAVLAWVAGIWAVGAIQQGRGVGLYAAMAVGVVLGLVTGLGDLLNLAYSQLPTALPATFARVSVIVCLGVGLGLVGGGFLALRTLGVTADHPAPRRGTAKAS